MHQRNVIHSLQGRQADDEGAHNWEGDTAEGEIVILAGKPPQRAEHVVSRAEKTTRPAEPSKPPRRRTRAEGHEDCKKDGHEQVR